MERALGITLNDLSVDKSSLAIMQATPSIHAVLGEASGEKERARGNCVLCSYMNSRDTTRTPKWPRHNVQSGCFTCRVLLCTTAHTITVHPTHGAKQIKQWSCHQIFHTACARNEPLSTYLARLSWGNGQ